MTSVGTFVLASGSTWEFRQVAVITEARDDWTDGLRESQGHPEKVACIINWGLLQGEFVICLSEISAFMVIIGQKLQAFDEISIWTSPAHININSWARFLHVCCTYFAPVDKTTSRSDWGSKDQSVYTPVKVSVVLRTIGLRRGGCPRVMLLLCGGQLYPAIQKCTTAAKMKRKRNLFCHLWCLESHFRCKRVYATILSFFNRFY